MALEDIIPFLFGRMDVLVARDLIDVGINEIYELQGRSAESIMEEIRKIRPETPDYRHTCVWPFTSQKMTLLIQTFYILKFGRIDQLNQASPRSSFSRARFVCQIIKIPYQKTLIH